ncbi:unnamed protein product [Prunus armeniaca]
MALTYPNSMNCGARLPVSNKRRSFQMKCAYYINTFQAAAMVDRVYDILVGFDDTYDKVRSDIL